MTLSNTPPPMTAWGKEQFDAHKPSYGPRSVLPVLGNDPTGKCDPLGYPQVAQITPVLSLAIATDCTPAVAIVTGKPGSSAYALDPLS